MEYACKSCIYLSYGRYCSRTYKKDKYYYGWVSLAEYSCNGKCRYYKRKSFLYTIKNLLTNLKIFCIIRKTVNIFKKKHTKKMIIVKTQMKSMPLSCKDCSIHLLSYSLGETLIGCPILRNWLTQEEIKDGKIKFPDCPLEDDNQIIGE